MKAIQKSTTIAVLLLAMNARSIYAQNPELDWVKSIAGTDTLGWSDDRALGITHDINGNILVTGYFHGKTDLDPGPGVMLAYSKAITTSFVVKLNAAGAFVFGAGFGDGGGSAITTDVSGNIYVAGYYGGTVDFDSGPQVTSMTALGLYDVFILKLNPIGNLIWAKSFGSTGSEQAFGVACDAMGNVYTTGYFEGAVDFDPGSGVETLNSVGDEDIFVSKLSAQGNFIWARRIGGIAQDNGNSIAVNAPTSEVFLTGFFKGTVDFDPGPTTHQFNSSGGLDFFVLKLDASGNFAWARQFGGSGTDRGNSIVMDPSGSSALLVAGSYYDTVDFDPGASTSNLTSLGQYDVFALKLDQAGNYVWSRSMGGSLFDYCYAVAADQNGDVYLTGQFTGTSIDYDPGPGVFNLTGNDDVFFVRLNSSGQFIWGGSCSGSGSDNGYGISVYSPGEPCIIGGFKNTVDFDPGPGIYELSNSFNAFTTGSDAFFLKLRNSPNGVQERSYDQESLFPNPCDGILHVNANGENVAVEIVNLAGEKVYFSELSRGDNLLDIAIIPPGVYFVKIKGKTNMSAIKLIRN